MSYRDYISNGSNSNASLGFRSYLLLQINVNPMLIGNPITQPLMPLMIGYITSGDSELSVQAGFGKFHHVHKHFYYPSGKADSGPSYNNANRTLSHPVALSH